MVDDDEDLCALLREVLKAHGYRTACANDIHQARDQLATGEAPAVVFLDWLLPEGNADELALDLRARGIPFVLASGHDEARGHAEAIGAATYLVKPFAGDDLCRVIEPLVGATRSEAPRPAEASRP